MSYDIGSKVFGSWEIVREIGHGAYGHVYEIRKTEFGVTAASALKLIRIPTSEKEVKEALSEGMDYESVSSYFRGFVDDLVAEISVMAKFSGHPNIVGYQDHHVEEHKGEIGWDILIRMELLESLINYMLRKKDLSEKQIIRLGRDIANALVTCEEQGIVHRDVKPDNIFVDPTGNFKLGDFGVARAIEKTTGGLSKKGTESYMAPEVYFGKPYGKSVDIYSLGLVLYRLTNKNRMPFYPLDTKMVSYTDREEALSKRMKGSPIPAPCDASPELAEIILKACAYDPKDRWQSATALKAALEDLMRGDSKKKKEGSLQSGKSETIADVSQNQPEETVGIHDNQSDETVGIRDNQSEETIGIHDEWSEETVGIREEQYEETVGIYSKPKKEKTDPTDPSRKKEDHSETPSYKSQAGSNDEPYDFTPETDTKKKKSTLIAVLAALAVVAGIVIYVLIPKAKDVVISGGSGSGKYKKGETVSIKAESKEGYDFTEWTIKKGNVTLEDSKAEETVFVMGKEPVELEAAYELKTYSLTVKDGTIQGTDGEQTGSFHEGDRIVAEPVEKAGYTFTGWKTSDSSVIIQESGDNLMFEMPAEEFTVTAEYEETTYSLTVEYGTINGGGNSETFTEGAEATIQAVEKEGYAFTEWVIIQGDAQIDDLKSIETKIITGKKDTVVQAQYEEEAYSVTVNGGSIDGGENGEKYKPGTIISIRADIDNSSVFSGWEINSGDIVIQSPSSEQTSFVMGNENVSITAVKEEFPILKPGYELNDIFRTLSGTLGSASADNVIQSIVFTDEPAPEDVNSANLSASGGSVIAWFDESIKRIYICTPFQKVCLDKYADGMFIWLQGLKTLDLSRLDTTNVTDCSYMFAGCKTLTELDLSSFDTSSVTDMSHMFYDCNSLSELDLSNIDTSLVTDMSGMFDHCSNLISLNISGFDTSSAKDMTAMFNACESLGTLDVSSFDTSSVADMHYMFDYCQQLDVLDLNNFDTSSVTRMDCMFAGCNNLRTLNTSSFDTSSVTDMGAMFFDCDSLTTLDLSNFDTSSVTNYCQMFCSCGNLISLNINSFNTSSVIDMSDMFDGCNLTELITQNDDILREYSSRKTY